MDKLYRDALRLEYFTVGYNILEAAASIFVGSAANSIALVGFGLDSIVESLSGLVLIWRLRKHEKVSPAEEEIIEKKAMKFVGMTFILLGLYVLYESAQKLIFAEIAEPSLPGITIAVLSIIIMPILSIKKRRLGEKMESRALVADSEETLACAFLSVPLLLGLLANYLLGFWQADPLVGLMIVIFLFREGWEWWRESEESEEGEEGEEIDENEKKEENEEKKEDLE
ncbi:MAG: cation transporter [Methanotrichaceae archaeon]|nr:cation transporter [Methanotrichaceae archaeon]